VKLHVKPNAKTGTWEIHDECGFFCKLESESTAALIVHAVNVLPELVAALEMAEPAVEYHHEREGCPITRKTVREAIRNANHINPPTAFRRRQKQKGKQHHGRNS
jgi:hypothetical protein